MRRPLYEIEGLVTFYPHFRTAPPPASEVAVCRDLSCRLARGRAELPEGATVHEVSCVGRCDRAPVAVVDESLPGGRPRDGTRRPNDPYASPERALRRAALVLRRPGAGARGVRHPRAWAAPASRPAASGAWCAARTRRSKYVICNADEAEPGTFKDRQILAEQPHLVVEGMLHAMRAIGATQG